MRLKPNHIYLIAIAILVSVSLTFAQESGSPGLEGMDTEKPSGGSETIYTEGEGSAQRIQSSSLTQPATVVQTPQSSAPAMQRESTYKTGINQQAKPKSVQQKTEESEAKPEDSVLGFNFLYYIFQRYKMSDIID